ncbi:LOW QUALITY PROTEIN: translation initiation factor IF-2-like, partial [Lutra lutra]|uniref:LOW QUALITY PROTEIN: translation initiation factor IF-2-like n=1 Tax=Lutra lutra TaxID=9657 RepID=UPI001FD354C4
GPWAFGRTPASLPWQGDCRGATPWLPALLQPIFPWGGHRAVGEVCEEEPIPPLAASAPALPVCMARLAGAPATGLTRTHRLLLPGWEAKQAPLCPASAVPRPATPLPARVGNHGAPAVGTCWLGNGAPRFGPETGQSERALEQSDEGETARVKGKVGASSSRLSPGPVTHWDPGATAGSLCPEPDLGSAFCTTRALVGGAPGVGVSPGDWEHRTSPASYPSRWDSESDLQKKRVTS